MTAEHMEWACAQTDLRRTRQRVLRSLASWVDEAGICQMSVPMLAQLGDLSERTVQYCLEELARKRIVAVVRGGGRCHTNTYALLTPDRKGANPQPETVQDDSLNGARAQLETVQSEPENGAKTEKGANPEEVNGANSGKGAKETVQIEPQRVQTLQGEPTETVQNDPETVQGQALNGASLGGEGGGEVSSDEISSGNDIPERPEGVVGGTNAKGAKTGKGAKTPTNGANPALTNGAKVGKGANSAAKGAKTKLPGVNLAPLFDEFSRRELPSPVILGAEQRFAGEILKAYGSESVVGCWVDIGDVGTPSDFADPFLQRRRNFKTLALENVVGTWLAWVRAGRHPVGKGTGRGISSQHSRDSRNGSNPNAGADGSRNREDELLAERSDL